MAELITALAPEIINGPIGEAELRTDGLFAYLMASQEEPEFAVGAWRNLKLLRACTEEGLLYSGPHMREKGELSCVHHSFSHAKVLAMILEHGLESRLCDGILPRAKMKTPR